jgi:hypothetical protein
VTVPSGCTARVQLPDTDDVVDLPSGMHHLVGTCRAVEDDPMNTPSA